MNTTIRPLPTAADGRAGLDALATEYGAVNTFRHIRWLRDHRPEAPLVGQYVKRLAATLVRRAITENPGVPYPRARQQCAADLGYGELSRTNFYKVVEAGDALPAMKYIEPPTRAVPLRRLPVPEDGEDGLNAMHKAFGTRALYLYLRWIRNHRADAPLVGQWMQDLAADMYADITAASPHARIVELARELDYSPSGQRDLRRMIGASAARAAT